MKNLSLIALGLWIFTTIVAARPSVGHAGTTSLAGPGSPVVFFEIYVADVSRAKSFYGQIFGWQFSATPSYPEMWQILPPAGGTAGALIQHPGRVNEAWGTIVYVHVEKIAESVALATKLGATIEVPIGV